MGNKVKVFAASFLASAVTFTNGLIVSAAEIDGQLPLPDGTEGGASGMGEIVSSTVATVTTTMGSLWTAIEGNDYLSFCVGVSGIAATVMVLKRMIGAARR